MSEDLWGDIPEAKDVITPLEILREQAKLLAQKTRGKLTANINRFNKSLSNNETDAILSAMANSTKPNTKLLSLDFHYSFELIAPALNNYAYSILEIAHDIELYPVFVFDWSSKKTYQCNDAATYHHCLATILQAEKTRNVIASLLKQSSS